MNRVAKILVALGACSSMLGQTVFAMNCETQFIDMVPHHSAAKRADEAWESKGTPEKIVTVLSAIGENGLPKINIRSLEKDGKILLGIKSQGQESILAIYRFDASVEGSEFRLVELRQKSSGNLDFVISEMPVDKTTGQLFPEVEAHPAIAAIRGSLALRLGPAVTNYIRETGEWFDFANAKDLRDLNSFSTPSAALRILHLRMRGRWVKEVLSKDLLKQVFRGLLLGGVVFGSSYLAQKLSDADEKTQKTILDSMAALLLIELANLEADAKVKIPEAERERIVQSALSLKGAKAGDGEILKLSQIEVAATTNSAAGNPQQSRGTEKFWVLDRLSGRVFVGLAEGTYDLKLKARKGELPRVELNTRALVEIKSKETPITYQIALAKFRSIEKVNVK
ncbi:MAG: hypothetical protein J0L82_06410 [Deltaproteobacteria bacterium]|nr:hypothetical protein [Deltaproteobacteria bacterium]